MGRVKKAMCSFPGCGRPARALGLCQTHYKQKRKYGELRPIKPKRQGRPGTVRYAGLSLTEACAEQIDRLAKDLCVAPNAVITDILEAWAARQMRKPPARSKRPARRGRR